MHTQRPTKRLSRILLAAGTTLATVLAGAAGPALHPAQAASGKLVYFIFTGFAYPYFAPMAQGVTAAAKLYPDLNIKIISANNSAATEISQINAAVANGAQGIILNPVQESVTHVAQQVMSKGIPVITIDRDVSSPAARIAFIGDKDVQLGQEQTADAMKYLASHHVPKPWHVAILEGTLGASTAVDRLQGEMNALKPYVKNGSAKIVFN